MSWGLAFRVRQTLKGSLWVVPLLGGLAGYVLSEASVRVEGSTHVPSGWDYAPQTALTALTTVAGASVGLIGFVVTVSVLVVQMATGTFSARYMRLWYRDIVLKATLAVLMGTLVFSYTLIRRIDEAVPSLGVSMAGFLLSAGLVLFLVFLDRVLHRLRPVKVASIAAHSGREAFRATVELATTRRRSGADAELESILAQEPSLVVCSSESGALQAIDDEGLLAWATHHDAVIVLRHGVGDFVSSDAVLVEVYGTAVFPRIAERRLAGRLALGIERTIDQDPAFALRILVDVAIRALSPAVNDPTTAVQVIDHLEDTLGLIGRTEGLDGRWEYRDDEGTPARDASSPVRGLLSLGVTEIRVYGSSSIQVMRRLRSALLELESSVLPGYVPAVEAELERLDITAASAFGDTPMRRVRSAATGRGSAAHRGSTARWHCHRPTGVVVCPRGWRPRTHRSVPLRACCHAAAEGCAQPPQDLARRPQVAPTWSGRPGG